MTEQELREALVELLRQGTLYAIRGESGELVYRHAAHGGSEDALPLADVIREIESE